MQSCGEELMKKCYSKMQKTHEIRECVIKAHGTE